MALLGTFDLDEYLPEYGTIVIRDTPDGDSWPEWTDDALSESSSGTIACAGNGWLQASAGDGYHTIRLEHHDSCPPGERDWDDVVDVVYRSFSGVVGMTNLTGSVMTPDLRLAGGGDYRVRVACRRGEDFGDTWRLQFWRAEDSPAPRWLRRSRPAVPDPDPGWRTILGFNGWEVPYIVSQAGGADGATTAEIIAWATAHHRQVDWLDEPLFPEPAQVLPSGHADIDQQAELMRSQRLDEAAAELAKLAGYAGQLGVAAPTTRQGLLDFLVAAGVLTFDGRYRLVSPQPLARDVLSLPADLASRLELQNDHHRYGGLAADLASVAGWLGGRGVTVPSLAERLLVTADEVRETLRFAVAHRRLEVSGDSVLTLTVVPDRRTYSAPPIQIPAVSRPAREEVAQSAEPGDPPRAGLIARGRLHIGEDIIELPEVGSRVHRALQCAYGTVLVCYSDPITLVRPGGQAVQFGTDVKPHVVLSEDGRYLATVEARFGRHEKVALHLYDLADVSYRTMPWDDKSDICLTGMYGGTVYFTGDSKPMTWAPGSDPEPIDRAIREIDPISGRSLGVDREGLIITDADGTTRRIALDPQVQLVPGGESVYRLRHDEPAVTVFSLTDITDPRTYWLPSDSELAHPIWESPATMLIPATFGPTIIRRLDLTTATLEPVLTPTGLQQLVEPLHTLQSA